MANLNFPASPSNNDTYTANGLTYKYDSTDGVWNLEGWSGKLHLHTNIWIVYNHFCWY